MYARRAQTAVQLAVDRGVAACAVVAQQGGEVGRAAGAPRERLGARPALGGARCAGAQRVAVAAREGLESETVGDAPSALADALHRGAVPGGLDHEGAGGVRREEAVVVGEAALLVAAAAPLAVLLEQGEQHLDGALRALRALEGEAQQVHAREAELRVGLLREHRLVPDHDAMLVGADLGAPHPERPREQHGVGLGDLRDLDPGAGHALARRVTPARLPLEELCLVGVAIRVLGEQHAPRQGAHHRVTHGAAAPPAPARGGRCRSTCRSRPRTASASRSRRGRSAPRCSCGASPCTPATRSSRRAPRGAGPTRSATAASSASAEMSRSSLQ